MKNELTRAVILNYLFIILTTLSSLIITPTLTNGLGLSLYGVYITAYSTISFFMVFDFGVGMPVIRNIVRYKDDRKELGNYLFYVLLLYILLAAVVFVLCLVIYFCAPMLFQNTLSPQEIDIFKQMFLIVSGNCALSFFVNYLSSIIIAYEKIAFTRLCSIIRVILRTALLVLVILYHFPPHYVFFVDLVVTALVAAIYIVFVFRLGVPLRPHRMNIKDIKTTGAGMGLSYWMAMAEGAYWTVCPLIIATTLDSDYVGIFSIGITFCTIYIQMSATLSHLRMPKLSALWLDKENPDKFSDYVLFSGRVQSGILGGILVGFSLFGQLFLSLWVGSSFDTSYYIALIVMASMFFPMAQSMLEVSLYAQEKYLVRTIILFAGAMAIITLLQPALRLFGLMGSAYIIAASTMVFNFGVMNLYYRRIYSNIKQFNTNVIIKTLPCILISAAGGFLLKHLLPNTTMYAILAGVIGMLIYAVLAWLLLYRQDLQRFRSQRTH